MDNGGDVFNLVLPDDAALEARARPDLLGGVTVLTGRAIALVQRRRPLGRDPGQDFLAVPYHAWANRGEGAMAVWLPAAVTRLRRALRHPATPFGHAAARIRNSFETSARLTRRRRFA